MRQSRLETDNPELDISFAAQNQENLGKMDSRLNVEILRVSTSDKIKVLNQIFSMDQVRLCQFFTSYQPFHDSPVQMGPMLESTHLKLIKNEGKVYFGEVNLRKKEGTGVYCHKGSKLYEGQFYNNQKQGQGVEIYSNGNLYMGQFSNNKKHGQGVFYWFSLGQGNNREGQQVEYYEGQWWGGLPDGAGIHQKINGDSFTGSFKNGLKHGEGEQYYGNGDYYKGQFVNGLAQGHGEYLWADGSSYKGDFKQGMRGGYGVWHSSSRTSEKYKGHYTNDKKTGYGVYQWNNGWEYKGNFDNDLRNGYGVLYDSEGRIKYKGFWENGAQGYDRDAAVSRMSKLERDMNTRHNSQFESHGGGSVMRPPSATGHNAQMEQILARNRNEMRMHMNRDDMGQYATLSHFGENNLNRRPGEAPRQSQSSTLRRNASQGETGLRGRGRSERGERSDKIGTNVTRPLMQNKAQQNFRVMSSKRI